MLVNNAGMIRRAPSAETSAEDWARGDRAEPGRRRSSFLQAFASPLLRDGGRGKHHQRRVDELLPGRDGGAGVHRLQALGPWRHARARERVDRPRDPGQRHRSRLDMSTDLTAALRDDPARDQSLLARMPIGHWGEPADLRGRRGLPGVRRFELRLAPSSPLTGRLAGALMEPNWAGNHRYRAERIHHPSTLEQVQEIVAAARRVRALGSRHFFTDIADSTGLAALDALPADVVVDRGAANVSSARASRMGSWPGERTPKGWPCTTWPRFRTSRWRARSLPRPTGPATPTATSRRRSPRSSW